MTLELILALVAIVASPLTAWLSAKLAKERYTAEIAKMRTEVEQMQSDVRSRELDNDKKAIEMIMELVVEPLRKDMKLLQDKLDLFTYAIEQIPTCPHADSCPVEHELRRTKNGGVGAALGGTFGTTSNDHGEQPSFGQHVDTCGAVSD